MMYHFCSLIALAAALVPKVAAVAPTDTYTDADVGQSGYLPNHNMDPAVVDSSAFGLLWKQSFNAQEQFYAKPLVYTPSAGGPQILFMASSQNNLYSLNAKTGAAINKRSVHTPFLQSDIGCTDVPNYIGIIGTPVIDPATDIAYFFSKTYIPNYRTAGNTGTFNGVYYFHGVNVNTLQDVAGFPILIDGSPSDNAPEKYFVGGIILQRPSLVQIGSVVYGAFGGHCDLFNYTGLVVGVDVNQKKVVTNFATESGPLVPQTNVWNQNGGGGEGGIWMSGMALSTDGNRLFWVSGNGDGHENQGTPASGSSGCRTLGEAVANLRVGDGGKLTLTDYFQPYDYQNLDGGDQDFGSGGVAILDPGTFKGTGVSKIAVTAGKNGKIYILNANDLGGYRLGPGQTDGIIQTITTNKPVFGGSGSYPLEGGYIYSTPVGNPTYAYKLGFSASGVPIFTLAGQTTENSAGRVGVGIPTVTSNGGKEGTGILWMCDPDAGLRAWYAVPGPDGKLRTINLPQVNGLNKFQRPVFGDTRLYVTDPNGGLYCLGSPVNLPLNCSSPVNYGQVALGSNSTQQVTCKANIAITLIESAVTGDAHFKVDPSTLPQGPVAQGASFTFPVTWDLVNAQTGNTANASYGNVSPGVKSTPLTITTVNAVQGYSTTFPISLTGTEVSRKAFLVEAPITVDFSGIVLLANQNTPSETSPFTISNAGLSPLTILGYAYTTDDLNSATIHYTNVTARNNGTFDLGVGFTSSNLPPVGTVMQGSAQISVEATFYPVNGVGSYSSYLFTFTDAGSVHIILEGSASTAPIANFSISNGEGGWLPQSNLLMDFGKVAPGTTSQRQIRICNQGGSVLLVSKSKPPNGAFRPDDPTALHESQPIPVGSCAFATVLFITNAEAPNVPDQVYTNSWTLNTDDLNFGVHVVDITGTLVSRKVGPTNSTGDPVYTYLGCFTDNNPTGRLLPSQQYADNNNDNGRCQTDCATGKYVFSGTEYQTECYCGNKPPPSLYAANEASCSFACSGDPTQDCGGAGGFISIYYDATRYAPGNGSTTATSGGPAIVKTAGNYNYIGCYSEATAGRALSGKAPAAPTNGSTIQTCETACQGYTYFGLEYSNECYCGNAINAGSVIQASDDPNTNGCSMLCAGDPQAYCGGPDRLEMYKLNGSLPVPTSTAGGTTPAGPTGGPSIVPLTGAFSYLGCYTESTNGRALSGLLNPVAGANLTIENCAAACSKYIYFGTEFSGECYCANSLGTGSVLAVGGTDPTQNGCSMTCNGNITEYCGGANRLSTYRRNSTLPASGSASPTAAPSATTSPAGPITVQNITGYSYLGCYSEGSAGRALTGLANPIPGNTVTPGACAKACGAYQYFGVEYSGECYCGDQINMGSALVAGNTPDVTGCSMICNGDQNSLCGGANRLNMYKKAAFAAVNSTSGAASTTANTTAASTPVAPSGPTAVLTVGNYVFQGCYSEATNGKALTGAAYSNSTSMTIEMCAADCNGFSMFGVEYGQECYCGNTLEAGSVKVANQNDCSFTCPGNKTEYCGAGNRLNMYQSKAAATTTAANNTAAKSSTSSKAASTVATIKNAAASTQANGTTSSTSSTSTSSSITSSKASSTAKASAQSSTSQPSSTTLAAQTITPTTSAQNLTSTSSTTTSAAQTVTPTTSVQNMTSTSSTTTSAAQTVTPTAGAVTNGWAYLGCANETTPRALSGASYSSNTAMTVEKCQAFCSSSSNNYGLAGVEYGGECYCGNGLQSYSSVGHDSCNMACTGNKTELCGGPSRLSVYNLTTYVPPTTVKQVGTFLSQGCYNEASNGRLLSGTSYTNQTGMTVESCVNFCHASGATYAGLEYGRECYCSSSLPTTAVTADASKCNMLCTGNSNEFCGSTSILNVYMNTPSSVSTAGTPKTANTLNNAVITPNTTQPAPGSKAKRAERSNRSMELRFRRDTHM